MRYMMFTLNMYNILGFLSEGEHHFAGKGIPRGAHFIRMDVDFMGTCRVVISHPSFDELKLDDDIPEFFPTFEKLD